MEMDLKNFYAVQGVLSGAVDLISALVDKGQTEKTIDKMWSALNIVEAALEKLNAFEDDMSRT